MPDKNYMSHSYGNCLGKNSDQKSIKDRLGGALVDRADVFKQYKNSETQREEISESYQEEK